LKDAGKKVIFYIDEVGDKEYYLASIADSIWMNPSGILILNGLSIEVNFYTGLLEKIGIKADLLKVGFYKSLPDSFTAKGMNEKIKQLNQVLLKDIYMKVSGDIVVSRKLSKNSYTSIIERAFLSPQDAYKLKLIDEIVSPPNVQKRLRENFGRGIRIRRDYTPIQKRRRNWAVPKKIAILKIEGMLVDGNSIKNPFGEDYATGDSTFIQYLKKVVKDNSIKAIVIRIDSPGGSFLASDRIWKYIMKYRGRKPIVVSIGDRGASGGYFVASAADKIFSTPLSITGSIGIWGGKFDLSILYNKIGLMREVIKMGSKADMFSSFRPFTEEERKQFAEFLSKMYKIFIDSVSEARGKGPEKIEEVAKGKIWIGMGATKEGLVDDIGGLMDAINYARKVSGIKTIEQVEYNLKDTTLLNFQLSTLTSGMGLENEIGILADVVFASRSRAMALMPYRLRIER
jgi:protease-4